jgi:MoaA/NifB/PqqE/SkfB family radical SAM enzyme
MAFKNGQISRQRYKPIFYRNWKIYSLTVQKLFKSFISLDTSYPKHDFLSSDSVIKVHQLRKKLLLYKLVRFNNQYYSTPTIPAFPSKAYDKMITNGGLNFLSAGTESKRQVDSVFLAITNKCTLKCTYCYERQNINNPKNIPSQKWQDAVRSLQKVGVNVFILTGGEPLLDFDKLITILKSANKDESDFHLHTSGYSVTEEKIKELKEAGLKAVAVGLDDYNADRHDKIRGAGTFEQATKALRLFNMAGILTYVNFCVNKEILRDNNIYNYYKFVKELNVSMIQLLEPRPCGGYFDSFDNVWLNEAERKKLYRFALDGNQKKYFKDYPLIYYVAHIEGKNQMGCHMGGLSHFYINSAGDVIPCVFLPIKYGNILEESITSIFRRMREKIPMPIYCDCPSLLLQDECKKIFRSTKSLPIAAEDIQDKIDVLYSGNKNHHKLNEISSIDQELKG